MRVFLSHSAVDGPIANYLKACFGRVLGVEVFMMHDDAPPGSEWIEVVRRGIETCEELFSLATPESVRRPWISAEWACFWLQAKPRTPLLVGSRVDELWEPMQADQAVDLLNPSRSLRFLQQLASKTGAQPEEGVFPLAHEIAEEIPRITARIRAADSERGAVRIAAAMRGTTDVDGADVALMVETGRLADLLEIAEAPESGNVKIRQVAVVLVALGRLGEALRLALKIPNRSESRTVAIAVIRGMAPGLGADSDEWGFLFGIFDHLRPPQRRDVRDEMLKRAIAPLGPWVDVPVLT